MADIDGANETVESLIDDIADEISMTPEQTVGQLKQIGLDVTEVTDEQAEKLTEAREESDPEKAADVLREHDVSEQFIEQIKDAFRGESSGEASPSDGTDEGETVDTSGDGNPSEKDIQRMIAEQTPSADEIAAAMETRMGGGDGGGQAQVEGGGEGGGGMDPQTQMAMQIASQFLGGGGTPGPMQQAQEKMMESMTEMMARQAARPSLEYEIGRSVTENLIDGLGIEVEGGENLDFSGGNDDSDTDDDT